MNKIILHIDFNSYFATVEQQANPRLRGKPIGVTGPDLPAGRQVPTKRTVIGAASIEAKKFGVKTGMQIWEARKLCPQIILVPGDSDKYLECTKRFLNILKDYSPYLEIFSIDEVFLEIPPFVIARSASDEAIFSMKGIASGPVALRNDVLDIAKEIKSRISSEIGEWIRVSIGISYNKLLAKLAGSLQKPDGLVFIPDQETAIQVLDNVSLDEICGIGSRIKSRLNKMGIFNFKQLRQVPLEILLFEFKSYGKFLYDAARGIDERQVLPFYEKEEVKSIGHRYTIDHDTDNPIEIKQTLLKLTELIARKLRAKKLVGKTVSCWFRYQLVIPAKAGIQNATWIPGQARDDMRRHFEGGGMQVTIPSTGDGLDIFSAAWKSFQQMWPTSPDERTSRGRDGSKIRMIGVSISNLKPAKPQNLSFLDSQHQKEVITKALDNINDKYGEFTLTRGILLHTPNIRRMPNSFLADRRFKI